MTVETSNARGDAEYEYEVWHGDELQAGGSTTDYASAQSEAGHYAMMYASGGPVEVRIYEKRLLNAAPPPADARGDVRYDRELIAQMLDAAEAPAFTMEEMDTQARLLREAAQAKPEARGDGDLNISMLVRDGTWVGTYAEWCRRKQIPPPSAPVGVEAIAAEIRASLGGGATVCTRRRWAIELEALAQQPAAVDEAAAIRAFEEHFQASSEDPYFEGELELWLTAWRKALAAQRGGRADG